MAGRYGRCKDVSDPSKVAQPLPFGRSTRAPSGVVAVAIVVMDCDLEDPPEWIPRLLTHAERGFDIVLTRHRGRTQARWRKLASRALSLTTAEETEAYLVGIARGILPERFAELEGTEHTGG